MTCADGYETSSYEEGIELLVQEFLKVRSSDGGKPVLVSSTLIQFK